MEVAEREAKLQTQRSRIAELELEVSALKEHAIEADRLQHELQATREKMRVMEQRAAILDKERQGAADQLEAELEAARTKINAIELRRRRRGGGEADAASTIVSAVTASSGGAGGAGAPSPRHRRGSTASGGSGGVHHASSSKSRHHASTRTKDALSTKPSAAPSSGAPKDRFLFASPRGMAVRRAGSPRAAPPRTDSYGYSAYQGY